MATKLFDEGFTTTPMAEAVGLQMSLQTAQAQPCLGCCSR